jgi:hypothetical protein
MRRATRANKGPIPADRLNDVLDEIAGAFGTPASVLDDFRSTFGIPPRDHASPPAAPATPAPDDSELLALAWKHRRDLERLEAEARADAVASRKPTHRIIEFPGRWKGHVDCGGLEGSPAEEREPTKPAKTAEDLRAAGYMVLTYRRPYGTHISALLRLDRQFFLYSYETDLQGTRDEIAPVDVHKAHTQFTYAGKKASLIDHDTAFPNFQKYKRGALPGIGKLHEIPAEFFPEPATQGQLQ